jgi:hypothetical protein
MKVSWVDEIPISHLQMTTATILQGAGALTKN